MTALRFECLEPIKTPLVNKFYDQYKARGRATRQDQVWVVYNDLVIVAACRIQNRSDYLFLSTLLVAPAWRGQGIAKKLLIHTLSNQNSLVYTFAYNYLADFYQSIGFNFVLTLPPPLDTLFTVYKQRNIVAMQC
ncbi:MAG: N-acetylglutamate synthase-like GNAT family acetyltransferase [Pseudoalteromonas rhizosphaerae]|jgi:N-acetylglutamate synthase-like GNAT family acetyltransferase|uniref:GNAT family N-acetyltransferase n=1 Tax=Pseudoalteromonas neustonica TaxID=1840331 RepID=A0ABY3FGJ9_9GAMM|nr:MULTISPECIES: GNAT family N-acetyltransferase [Pseudoalteromonas]MBB1408465.1 GNAT family N-acetyltransferase [Pseudoalteromonas sp. SG44-17]TVU85103.1 GNAT family N-acetyltransferase [Pseudoalteromonas neustonica]